jgi:hypothetical protein
MSLRSKLGMFVLTRQEQRTIAFIVLAVILGLVTQRYRQTHSKGTDTKEARTAQFVSPSPSPVAGQVR